MLRLAKDEFGLCGVKSKSMLDRTRLAGTRDGLGSVRSKKEAGKVKTTIVAFLAAALIAAAPAVAAQNVPSKAPGQHHKTFQKHPHATGYVPRHAVHAPRPEIGYPKAFGYAPSEPKDYTLENSRQSGGGGGGGM
jgi:hypothetical protein